MAAEEPQYRTAGAVLAVFDQDQWVQAWRRAPAAERARFLRTLGELLHHPEVQARGLAGVAADYLIAAGTTADRAALKDLL